MNQKWGREKDAGHWPSDKPLWAIGAFILAFSSLICIGYYRYEREWTPLQRFYATTYVWTRVAGTFRTADNYTILMAVKQRGESLALDNQVQPILTDEGKTSFTLTEGARKAGVLKLEWEEGEYDNLKLHFSLAHWIYKDQTPFDLARPAFLGGLGMLVLGLITAIPLDAAREKMRKYGRRLKGPQLVSPRTFNSLMHSDGIGLIQERTFLDTIFLKRRRVRFPRELESKHFLVIGDSGQGKSSLIRQILLQIEERGETAVIYDPASPADYTPYFFRPSRGDFILNPLDERMPFWTLADELREGADALTIAASLFTDRPNVNSFFFEAPRKIFAHLITSNPSPQQLVSWMSHPEEIDRRVKGTEHEAMLHRASPEQRGGILSSLSLVADAMKLLPGEAETERHWSTLDWSKERCGWIFITSRPDTRKRLAPLFSLWIDLLVLRLMNQGQTDKRPVWFILDDLASLQRLSQLLTAITESRKSKNPVVLTTQGRSQLEALYGQETEPVMSQPATKIFLATSEPGAARWISDAIGEQEIERLRESRTTREFPSFQESKSYSLESEIRPLVMPSEIMGLEKRRGYLKCGNLVVPLNLPYLKLPVREPAFVPRPMQAFVRKPAKPAEQLTLPYATRPNSDQIRSADTFYTPHGTPGKTMAVSAAAYARSGDGQLQKKPPANRQKQRTEQKIEPKPIQSKRRFFE